MEPKHDIVIDDAMVTGYQNSEELRKAIAAIIQFRENDIDKAELVDNFGAIVRSSSESNIALFRKSRREEAAKEQYWLLRFIDISKRNIIRSRGIGFKNLTHDDLRRVATFSAHDENIDLALGYLETKGINVFFIKSYPGTRIDGATLLTSHNTLSIGLTLRYDRLDYFWFTLLHELAHAVLHVDYLREGIISEEESSEVIELEANRLAKDSIVPPFEYRVCIPKRTLMLKDLKQAAMKYSIHPALLAGLIRKDLNRFDVFSDTVTSSKIRHKVNYE